MSFGRGTTQQSSAPYNRRIVLDLIRRRGAVSRKEIVAAVSLSPQTVANITQDLESIGLIVSRRQKLGKSRGQPPIALALNPDGGKSIGISLEPGRALGALVNLVGDVVARHEIAVDTHDQALTLAAMVELIQRLSANTTSSERMWGVGVALPGPFDAVELSFVGPTTFEGWSDLSILDELHNATGLHVFYSVDSLAGALGESLYGVAKGFDNFFYMHFGIGLGGTLVTSRTAYKGANGNATEIGHIPIVADGKPCYCGNKGCLERYLSLHSLFESLRRAGIRDVARADLAQMLCDKNPALLEWCREAAIHLRDAVCTLENLLDPQCIVIGGSAPRPLVEFIISLAPPWHHSVRGGVEAENARIVLCERQEDSSILGAAVLPVYEMLSPRFEVLLNDKRVEDDVSGLLGHRSKQSVGRL